MSFLYDQSGQRKYLTIEERRAFLRSADSFPPNVRTFCKTLAYTGARVSEVLALSPNSFDFSESLVRLECLKKRRRGVYRSVPLPSQLLNELERTHEIQHAQQLPQEIAERLWPWCRTTAWKHTSKVMQTAGISGAHANPKGLRHSFGVTALQKNVPLNMVRKWLGHSRLSTTAIYGDAVGPEELEIAHRLWRNF